nr:MAG TPA: hypothetical protein [Caudoviricetes sp.]
MGILEIVFLSLTIMLVLSFIELFRFVTVFDFPLSIWNYIELSLYLIGVMVGWYVIVKEFARWLGQ